jgi:hypothetical protein
MKTVNITSRKESPEEKAKKSALCKDLGSRLGNTETSVNPPKIEPILLRPEAKHQKRLHPEDLKVLARINTKPSNQVENSSIYEADEFGIGFDRNKLLIFHKGTSLGFLTSLETRLCSHVFTKDAGYKFKTPNVEEFLYQGESENLSRMDKFKSVVKRLNKKIKNKTGIEQYFKYSVDYFSRKI